jgi:hypothetical protein
MKRILLSLFALSTASSLAFAQPVQLTADQMDRVTAGALTDVTTNPAGHAPPGQQGDPKGQAMDTETQNPAGHAPPGHNK